MSHKEKWAVIRDLTATIAAMDWVIIAQIVKMLLDLFGWLDKIDDD